DGCSASAQTAPVLPFIRLVLGQPPADRLVPAAQEWLANSTALLVHRGVRARNVPGVAPNLARCPITLQRRNALRRRDRADTRARWIHAGGDRHRADRRRLPSWQGVAAGIWSP